MVKGGDYNQTVVSSNPIAGDLNAHFNITFVAKLFYWIKTTENKRKETRIGP